MVSKRLIKQVFWKHFLTTAYFDYSNHEIEFFSMKTIYLLFFNFHWYPSIMMIETTNSNWMGAMTKKSKNCKAQKQEWSRVRVKNKPVDTRRRFNVYKTSIRRRRRRTDVLYTLKRRCVSTGKSVRNENVFWTFFRNYYVHHVLAKNLISWLMRWYKATLLYHDSLF